MWSRTLRMQSCIPELLSMAETELPPALGVPVHPRLHGGMSVCSWWSLVCYVVMLQHH